MELTDLVGSAVRRGHSWGVAQLEHIRVRREIHGPRPCDGVVLDVDDTVIDTDSAILTAAQTAALELWPESTTSDRERFAELFRFDPRGHFAGYTDGQIRFHDMRKLRIGSAADELGLGWDAGRYRRFCSVYDPAFAAAQRLHPDALPAVAAMRRWGIKVVLLTNSSTPATRMKLQVLGIADRFPQVVTTDTLGFGKPDPRVFRHACTQIGTTVDRSIAIGDNFVNDVAAARAAGLRGLWLDRTGSHLAGHAPSIHSLSELPAALRAAQ